MTASQKCFLLLFLMSAVTFRAQTASPAVMTASQYAAELDRILAATQHLDKRGGEIPGLLKSLPASWQVQIDQRKFEVSTDWLRGDLTKLEQKYDPQLETVIGERLNALRSDLDAYQKSPIDISQGRNLLSSILARREFHDVHGPTWLDRLKRRLLEFLSDVLSRFVRSSSIPAIGRVLTYSLMGLAVVALGFWVYRNLWRDAQLETIMPESLPVSAKEWTVWMAEARQAANSGNWRDAIHLAYWAGISFLEAQGMWRPDQARTPREYLRLLPSKSQYHVTLSSLTRSFEIVWYGNEGADGKAFSEALENLEKLGCR